MGIKGKVLGVVRRGPEVAWVPEWMGLGNLLYMGKWAFDGRADGRRVLLHDRHAVLLGRVAPVMACSLFVKRADVPFTAQRVMPWGERADYSEGEPLAAFVEGVMLPGSEIASAPGDLRGAVVVNARRGDYYSVPQHEAEYGMDQVAYVRAAVARSVEAHGAPRRFVVVSDDQDWCGEHLRPVLEAVAPVELPDGDAVHDLATVVHAERLILPNSTFSYWGGFIGDVLRPGREVYAPRMFSRSHNGGRADQLLPGWGVVADGCPV